MNLPSMLIREERRVPAKPRTFVLLRQCGLCDHATLEHKWLCSCCEDIEDGGSATCVHLPALIIGPLLPPFIPNRVRHLVAR